MATTPSFFSFEGQKLAGQRVLGTLNPFGGNLNVVNPFTGSSAPIKYGREVVTTLEVTGAAAYAAAGTIALGGGTLAGGASLVGRTAASVAKTAVKYPKTALATLIIGPGTAAAVLSRPEKVGEAATSYVNLQKNITNFAINPSEESGRKIFEENPYATVVAGGTLALLGGAKLPGLVSSYQTSQNTNAIKEGNDLLKKQLSTPPGLPQGATSVPTESKAISGLPQGTPGGSPTSADVNANPKLPSINPEKVQAMPKVSRQKRKVYKKRSSCCTDGKSRKVTLRIGAC